MFKVFFAFLKISTSLFLPLSCQFIYSLKYVKKSYLLINSCIQSSIKDNFSSTANTSYLMFTRLSIYLFLNNKTIQDNLKILMKCNMHMQHIIAAIKVSEQQCLLKIMFAENDLECF